MAKVRAVAEAVRSPALLRAWDLFYDAEYERCAELLGLAAGDHREAVDAIVLVARALYRAGDVAGALAAAKRACERAISPNDVVLAQVWRGNALRASKKAKESILAFDRAAAALSGASDPARDEYAYYLAFAAWEDGELARAESLVEERLSSAEGVLRGMLVQLLGWIEVRRERYAAAATRFLEALDVFAAAPRPDVRFTARLVHGLAVVASETIDLRLAHRYERHLQAMHWTSGVTRQQFNTITCERFIALLQGDLESAWRRSLDAIAVAPSAPLRAIAETNAAVCSGLVGDAFATRAHFAQAWRTIESVSWSGADEEERVALTNFAIEAAPVMPSEARSAIARYRNITGSLDARLSLHGDRRMSAFEAMAAGRVSEVLGKSKDAIINYERSLQLWVALDYRMRAALVARDLHRLTKNDSWLRDVNVAIARAPNAWFADPLLHNSKDSPVLRLTPAERNVLKHLLSGESTSTIATMLKRSPYTIHNHTRRVFAAFQVRTRPALLARCAEQDITADKIA